VTAQDRHRHLVFDVGGTQLRASVYDGASAALGRVHRVDAPSYLRHPALGSPELRHRLIVEMSALRAALDPDGAIASAAVSFPGPVDGDRRVLAAPTLWGPGGPYPHDLEAALRGAWPGTDVLVLNDVAAAGYRYLRGPGDELCVVAVSTGIGNKVFVDGRPLVGPRGHGGEIGHLRVDFSEAAARCDCGGRGHLSAVASGRGLAARAREHAERAPEAFARSALASTTGQDPSALSAEMLALAYRAGDAWAADRIGEGASALGSALAAIHLAIGVERFVLIGGFAVGLGQTFCEAVGEAAARACWQGEHRSVVVALGEADGHCALVGAGRAAQLRASASHEV
jgi:glucokinase